ncbi:unnamed protein product [Candida verbasci]|uniref:Uncharacterized protein n=1 Tax=Candida verbasci TaxID=1227364 RepID=A0A9W4XL91_9ASCO|nr:unnamed protein product [Candida verbasci]
MFRNRFYSSIPRSLTRSIHIAASLRSNFAFVFDIDGVLIRGEKPIPQAKTALQLLNKHKIPYILMTNGGGVHEYEKAQEVERIHDNEIKIDPLQIVQSHTPMKALATSSNSFNRVLVVGGVNDNARKVALDYGFKDVIIPMDIVLTEPSISPHHTYSIEQLEKFATKMDLAKPIEAILVFNDPRDMSTDIQIVMDLLNSKHGLIGTKRDIYKVRDKKDPSIPIIFSNNDFVYSNDFSLPRFGQGAYRIIIKELYKEVMGLKEGENLNSLIMGKPFKIQYDFAHHVLINWQKEEKDTFPSLGHTPSSTPFKQIYMVGDNPASDIEGANLHGWESILLRTGVYKDEDWDYIKAKPTVGVFDNVEDAIRKVLQDHGMKVDE